MVAKANKKVKNEVNEKIDDDLEIKKEENDDEEMKEEDAEKESGEDEPATKKLKEEQIETETQDEEVKEDDSEVTSKKQKRGRGAPKKKPIKKEASSEADEDGKNAVVEDETDDDETVEPGKIRSLKTLNKFITNQDNSRNIIYMQDIPEICKDKPCMLGVDEAGRGPVLGPMVYGIAFCPIESKELLVDLGCADSKQLTEEKRDQIFQKFNKQEKARTTMGWAVELISPNTISTSMYRRSKYSLNEISMGSAIGLITMALDAGVNVAEVYVDTVGPPEKYQDKLKGIFPQIPKIVVAKKADSTYPIVSAASICAKVTRDHALQVWQFPEGLDVKASEFGSGYPGDPVTKRFLSDNIDSLFGFPRLVRFSWSTAENALMDKAFDMEFDEPEQEKPKYAGPKLTKFFKGTSKDGEVKREPCRFLKERFLSNVVDF